MFDVDAITRHVFHSRDGVLVNVDNKTLVFSFFILFDYLPILFILEKLAAQTLSARKKLTGVILPYVVLPHRVRQPRSSSIQYLILFLIVLFSFKGSDLRF
jgi:hypothetical protein